MFKLHLLEQHTQTNVSDKRLNLPGKHAIIAKHTKFELTNSDVSTSIITDNSKLIGDTTTCDINATNNSMTAVNNLTSHVYTNNNSITNFPEDNHKDNLTISDIPNFNGFLSGPADIANHWLSKLTTTKNNTEIKLNTLPLHKVLSNTGSKFVWYGNTLADLDFIENIGPVITFKVDNSNISTLKTILTQFPKNLHGKTFLIQFTANITSNAIIECEHFYNGIIEFSGKNYTVSSIQFYCNDIENLKLHNFTFNSMVQNSYIELNNINCCEINDCKFELSNPPDIMFSSEQRRNYKNLVYSLYKKNNGIKIACECKNSYLNLHNNTFKNCTYLTIIASQNSKLISHDNTFYANTGNTKNIRKILHYAISNSLINAYANTATITNDINAISMIYENNVLETITLQEKQYLNNADNSENGLKNSVEYTILYGYAYPGSIFNHEHLSKLVMQQKYKNKDKIKGIGLPIGSIYLIPQFISKNVVKNNMYNFDTNEAFGYAVLQNVPTCGYIGNTYTAGKYTFNIAKNAETNFKKALENFYKDTDTSKANEKSMFPVPEYTKRYLNKYCENILYSCIYKWHFQLNCSPYFNHKLLDVIDENMTTNALSATMPKNTVYSQFFVNDKAMPIIQYSNYTYYNKSYYISLSSFITTLQEDL